ncbi:MAG: carboxylating nicotinate-nucleotide diphosphorylase [Omnitrophica bacterium]|nr:carboxylating nicotinate-nucleotide diphosphorylase [Candidatus Omnitrophota bacterium]
MLDKSIKQTIQQALKEDSAKTDITTKIIIPPSLEGEAVIVARQKSILCGIEIAAYVFKHLDEGIQFKPLKKDGAFLRASEAVATIRGGFRAILSGERTALNFLSLLSGISTSTEKFVQEAKGSRAKIMDTRKTTPGLRALEKYAVKIGGGYNHRKTLSEGVIVKDNHLRAAKCISKTDLDEAKIKKVISCLKKKTMFKVEIEVENLREFKAVVKYRPHIVMLDNFSLADIKKAVSLRNKYFPKLKLEASGGMNLRNVKRVANSGVDFISVGTITHSPPAVDFSLEVF